MIILTEEEASDIFNLFMPDYGDSDAITIELEALSSGCRYTSIDQLIIDKMKELTLRLNRSIPNDSL